MMMCDLKENPTKEEEEDRNDGRLFMQWLCDTTGSLKTRRGRSKRIATRSSARKAVHIAPVGCAPLQSRVKAVPKQSFTQESAAQLSATTPCTIQKEVVSVADRPRIECSKAKTTRKKAMPAAKCIASKSAMSDKFDNQKAGRTRVERFGIDKELDPRDRCLTKKEIYKRHKFGKRKRNEMDPIELAALRLKERVERRKQRIKKRDMTDPLERLKTAELPEMKIMLLQALEAKRVVESDYNTVLSLVTLLHQNEAANGNDTHALRLECLSEEMVDMRIRRKNDVSNEPMSQGLSTELVKIEPSDLFDM